MAKESVLPEHLLCVSREHGARLDELEELYRNRFAAFVGGALAVSPDLESARDAVQEGFARAVAKRRSFRGGGSLEGWVWRIVLNAARETRRRERMVASRGDADGVAAESVDARASELRTELRALPERQRVAIFLHYYGDLSYDEVARLLQIAPGTVAASLHAARANLRARVLKEG